MPQPERSEPTDCPALSPEAGIHPRQREVLARLEHEVAAIQDSASFRRYLDVQARFHAYSYNNVLLIMSQRPDATRVASYQTWRTLERQVVRGETGIKILYPMLRRVIDEDSGEPRQQLVGFGIGNVFDIGQTIGKPLPERALPELDSREGLGLLLHLYEVAQQEALTVTNIPAWQLETGLAGYYRRASRQIVIQEGAPSQMTVTLAHELAHHFGGDEQSYTLRTRPHEETMAEGAAYVVCAHYGLDTGPSSFEYVATWAKAQGTLRAALGRIQRVSATIIGQVEHARAEDAARRAGWGETPWGAPGRAGEEHTR